MKNHEEILNLQKTTGKFPAASESVECNAGILRKFCDGGHRNRSFSFLYFHTFIFVV